MPQRCVASTAGTFSSITMSLIMQMRYRNNSNYKNDTEIRKKAYVSQAVLDELKRIIEDAEVSSAAAVLLFAPALQQQAVKHHVAACCNRS